MAVGERASYDSLMEWIKVLWRVGDESESR